MPCDTILKANQSLKERMEETKRALELLERELQSGRARVVIGPNGAVSFVGWTDRRDLSDACAYRTLAASNSWALRQAVAKAEAMAGRKVNPTAVAQGWHTHDGKNWSKH